MNAHPGRLDQRVTIQRATTTADGGGGETRTWATVATVWARAEPRAAGEKVVQDRVTATYVVRFTIRNRSDLGLSEVDRVAWQGEAYNIRGIYRAGPREMYLSFDAERGVAS